MQKTNFRDILFVCNTGAKAAEAARNICGVFGENSIGEMVLTFQRVRYDVRDSPRSGKLSGLLIQDNPRQSAQELGDAMNRNEATIVRHSHSVGKVSKFVFHALGKRKETSFFCASLIPGT